jgi:hypothetical protein
VSGGVRSTDEILVAALAAGQTVVDAAKAAHISDKTARRRMKEPDFQARVIEARGQFTARMTKAGDTMDALLNAESEQVRLGAARAIIQQGLALRSAAEIEARLTALENQAGADADELARLRKRYPAGTNGGEDEGHA